MSTQEEVLMREIEGKEKKEKAQMCIISKSGLTLFGFHVSWIVVILVAILAFFLLRKSGMLPESVSDILSSPESAVAPSVASPVITSSPSIMTGGFRASPFSRAPGQVRQMMGH